MSVSLQAGSNYFLREYTSKEAQITELQVQLHVD